MDVRADDRGKFFTSRISKESVGAAIRTTEHLIVGEIYVRPEERLKDELNQDKDRFLAITDARVYDTEGTSLLFESSFLIVGYSHIIMISPLDAIKDPQLLNWIDTEETA